MSTQVFKDYSEFLEREDKTVNGVSPEFAEANPDYEADNYTNYGCWNCSYCSYCRNCSDCSYCSYCRNCSDCSYCRNCSDCSSCRNCSYCSSCSSCSYCSDCSYCRNCSYCSYCRNCSSCSYCRNCRNCSSCRNCSYCSSCSSCRNCSYCSYCRNCSEKQGESKSEINKIEIPIIQDIHKKVYAAASVEGALDMGDWHTCGTTHCRAGWVTTLAGEAGKDLEAYYGNCLAAQLIYRESGYEINPCRFFDKEDEALADMKRLAEIDN